MIHDYGDNYLLEISRENGGIERLGAALFVLAGIIGILNVNRADKTLWKVFAFFMFTAAAREMDLHKSFTSDSIFKIKFYTSDAPVGEKLGGAIFIILLFLSLAALIRILFKRWRQIRYSNTPVVMTLAGLGFLACGKFLDGMARYVPALAGFKFEHDALFRVAEETIETAGALLFVMAALNVYTLAKR